MPPESQRGDVGDRLGVGVRHQTRRRGRQQLVGLIADAGDLLGALPDGIVDHIPQSRTHHGVFHMVVRPCGNGKDAVRRILFQIVHGHHRQSAAGGGQFRIMPRQAIPRPYADPRG